MNIELHLLSLHVLFILSIRTQVIMDINDSMDDVDFALLKPLDEKNTGQRTYLVTYSQADTRKFPTRALFGRAVATSFGGTNVDYFAVGTESHEDGGIHYHCSIRLNKTMRWKSSKSHLSDEHGIIVNYATSSAMYMGAFRYATKNDRDFYMGNVLKKHPNCGMVSDTYQRALSANNTYCHNVDSKRAASASSSRQSTTTEKKKRIQKSDVAMFIVENNIHTELELKSVSVERRDAGDRALYDYLFRMRQGDREALVLDAWSFENAKDSLAECVLDRVQRVRDCLDRGDCNCGGLWLRCAKDIMVKNNINESEFCASIMFALEKGRSKGSNIILIGPADCAKTFLIKPVCSVLKPNVFNNPANSTFGWIGVEDANVIFLNDLRWAPRKKEGNIDWDTFLNLLEGALTTLPAPMNSHSKHVIVKKKMPIFATSITEVTYWVNHPEEPITDRHREENRMMESRWKVFRFHHRIPRSEKIVVGDCEFCFAKFVLQM